MSARPLLAAVLICAVLSGCDTMTSPSERSYAASPRDGATGSSAIRMAAATADSVDLLVLFVPGTAPEEGSDEVFEEQDVRRRGYVQESTPGVAITVASSDLDVILLLLSLSPIVDSVEFDITLELPAILGDYVPLSHDYTGHPNDATIAATTDPDAFEGQMLPWSVDFVGGDSSTAVSGDGSGTVDMDVYVIDSGVDHPEVNVVESVRFFPASADPGSTLHGNHVAGIIGATDDGTGMVGVAPGVRIHSLDVFDGSGTASMSRLIQAMDHVLAARRANPSTPMVVNLSVGANVGTTELNALDRAVQQAIQENVVVVVAAGNQAIDASQVSPAHVPDAITVGAYGTGRRFAADFSNYGSVVDLMAPGVRVVSAADDGKYAALDGTSMAAPHVAGAAALYLATYPTAHWRRVGTMLGRRGRDFVRLTPDGTTDLSVWLTRL